MGSRPMQSNASAVRRTCSSVTCCFPGEPLQATPLWGSRHPECLARMPSKGRQRSSGALVSMASAMPTQLNFRAVCFGALDALTRSDLQAWLAALWEQERSSVLLVTHDVEEAVFLADRVIVLTPRPGRVAFELTVSLPRPRTRSMIASSEFIRDRATLLQALGLLGAPLP